MGIDLLQVDSQPNAIVTIILGVIALCGFRFNAKNLFWKNLLATSGFVQSPSKSVKYFEIGLLSSFLLNRSILFKNKIKEVLVNQRELDIDSNSIKASCI
jgi:hypothetical protein